MRPRGDRGEVTLILEVKGYETEQDRAKGAAAHRWVAAVNNWGEFGRWALVAGSRGGAHVIANRGEDALALCEVGQH